MTAAGAAFTLYVSGQRRSRHAIENVRRLLTRAYPDHVLTIVDVSERPEMAAAAGILATPTLARERPAPRRLLIGDFGDSDQALAGLNLATSG